MAVDITGSLDRPQVAGSARITDGRLRHLWMPHAIENINGRIGFAGNSVRLDDVTATMAKGKVAFGGQVALQGLWPSRFDVDRRAARRWNCATRPASGRWWTRTSRCAARRPTRC